MAMRLMRIMTYANSREETEELQKGIEELGIPCTYLSGNNNTHYKQQCYYFQITTDSAGYQKIEKKFPNIYICDDMEIANKLDCDNDFFDKMMDVLKSIRESHHRRTITDRGLLDFVKSVDNPEQLKTIYNFFEFSLDERERMIFRDRIDILGGDRENIDEEFTEGIMSLHCDIKELRKKTGMNRKEFCKYFKIPYRTVEDWENKKSSCSTYLFDLMKEKLIREHKLTQ